MAIHQTIKSLKTKVFPVYILFLLLIHNFGGLFAQNYPVTCTPIVKPSFSLKWSEISTSSEMFKVHLLLKDLTKPSVDVYLKIRLSGVGVDIRTVDGFIPSKTILLNPGSAVLLNSVDLAEYFNISNLVVDGIDISALYAGGRLPEGLYTWTVEAYEIDRNRQVSNTGMALMNVFKNYPPIINIPQEGAILPVTNPQNILFSWTSRSTASLNAAQGKTYKLRIYPLNADEDPNMVANSGIQPIEITTTTPYFNYGATNIALEKGKRYAVQVQEEDINGLDDYENEGKSQVVSFSFGKPCITPEGLTINPIEKGRVELTWEQNDETSTTVWYKQSQSNIWNNLTVDGKSTVISNLKDKTAYEFKVSSNCGANTNAFGALDNSNPVIGWPNSEIYEFIIDDSIFDEKIEELDLAILDPFRIKVELLSDGTSIKPKSVADIFEKIIKPKCANNASSYEECSTDHPKIPIPTGEDLTSLTVGDVLGIYDYAVLVTEVGGGNALSGKGLVKLPFLDGAFMAVEFSGIKIKKGEHGTYGGCVYEVPDAGYFRNRNISQSELQNEQIKAIAEIIKLTDPTIFHGDLEATLLKYKEKGEEITTNGTATPQDKQDLLTYTKGIETAVGTWKDKFTEIFTDEGNPKIVKIMDDMKAIISQLNTDKQTIEGGTSFPIIANLKEKIDAIIEKIKALQEEQKPKLPKIQNVLATNISYNDATITWQGDPKFTKYVVSYKTADDGELIETVNSNRLTLKNLQESSRYGLKIEGYVDEKLVDSYYNGTFTTLQNKLPMPENVKQVKVNDNTLTLTWDKNKLHENYKVVFKNKNGFIGIIYPKANTVTLKDLVPDENYEYTIVAYGNNVESDPAKGDFTSSICRGLIEPTAMRIVESTTVTLTASPSCINIVSWGEGMPITNQRSITVTPDETTTYELSCTIEFKNGETKVCNDKVEITVDKKCTDVVARATTYDITQGEEVGLIVKGCSSDVIWKDEKLNIVNTNKIWLNTPTSSQTYAVYCKNSNSEACAFQLPKINVKCELKLIQNDLDANIGGFGTPSGSVMVTALGCTYGKLDWIFDGGYQIKGQALSPNQYKISNIKRDREAKIKAICTLSDKSCPSDELIISRPNVVCGEYANTKPHTLSILNNTVQISSNVPDYPYVKSIKWLGDNTESILKDGRYYKTFTLPTKTTAFEGIAIVQGSSGLGLNQSVRECPFTISYIPKIEDKSKTPTIPPTDCTPFEIIVNPNVSSIVRGTEITLSTKGCDDGKNFGTVTWTQTLGVDGKVKPLENTTYESTCEFAGETIIVKKEIKVTDPIFTVSPIAKSIILGESVTLTASNCTNGEAAGIVKWDNGSQGTNISVIPIKEGATAYTATCFINNIQYQKPIGVVITATKTVTNYLPPHPCDFSVTTNQPSYIANVNATINVVGCAGWIKWQSDDNPNLWGQTAPPANNVSFTVPTGNISNSYTVQCGDIKGNPAYCKAKVWIWVNVTQAVSVNLTPPIFSIPQTLTNEDCSIYGSNKNVVFGIPTNAPDGNIPINNSNNKFAVWAIGGPENWSTGKKPNEIAILDKVCISNGNTLTWYENDARTIRTHALSSTGAGFALFVPTPDKSKTYWGLCTKKDGSYCKISATIDPNKIYSPNSIINIEDNINNERLATAEDNVESTNANCGGFITTEKAVGDILKNLICDNGKLVMEAPITKEKVESIKNTILENPIFEGINLPAISDALILEIASDKDKCKTAIDGLVKDVEGTSLKENFNTLATDPDLIDNVTNLIVTANSKQPTCKNNDGEISVSATGGTGTYEYKLSTSTTWQVSNVFKNLKAGSYTILVKDNGGNSSKKNVELKGDCNNIYFIAGAGLDTKGWDYTNRWKNSFEKKPNVKFIPILDVSHDPPAADPPKGDIIFTITHNATDYDVIEDKFDSKGNAISFKQVPVSDIQLTKAIDFVNSQLQVADKTTFIGYSYGSVMVAQLVLQAKNKPNYVILVGSPVPTDSELFRKLSSVTQIMRIDIPNDEFSNPSIVGQLLYGGLIAAFKGDNHPHFDYARPGAIANAKINELVTQVLNFVQK